MPLRNGEHGYGAVTKLLHWVTVAALATQLAVGYTMDPGDLTEAVEERIDRLEERCDSLTDATEERCEAAVERREEALEAQAENPLADALTGLFSGDGFADGLALFEWHVLLGLGIIALGLLRLGWRATTPLPPWSAALGPAERRLEAMLEKVLLALLFVVPGTGLLLVAGRVPLALHVAAHVALYAGVALHVGLVLRHTVVRREGHLARIL